MPVSLGMNRGFDQQPDKVVVGTLATSTNDIEVRIDTTKGFTNQDVILLLKTAIIKLEDGRTDLLPNV